MSRQRVVTGTDARGRPTSTWADPEPDTARAYGHMEPAHTATIERRKATTQELEAARAREVAPTHLTAPSLARPSPITPHTQDQMQVSRQRGAQRHVEVLAARKTVIPSPAPSHPEEIMSEPRADHSYAIPELDVIDGLDRVAVAANDARQAWSAKVNTDAAAAVATEAWEQAREALDAAYRAFDGHLTIVSAELVDALEAAVAEVEAVPESEQLRPTDRPSAAPSAQLPTSIGGGPEPRRFPTKPRLEELPLTPRQEQILAATVRLDGDRKAVAKEFGLKAYQSVDIALEVAGKKGRLPIALIPKLPARFAKYSGV